MRKGTFVTNLALACASRRSIAEVCRQIGLNRQQFNRYISGQARPSPHNMMRIASYFGVSAEEFDLPRKQFEKRLSQPDRNRTESRLLEGFPGDIDTLRRHLGYYRTYHISPSWPGLVVSSCCQLSEEAGLVRIKSIERIRDPDSEIVQFSKYDGLVTCWRERLFITERKTGAQPILSQTILTPFEQHQRVYLRGTTMGVSWRNQNLPYASRMIWRALGTAADPRRMLEGCGVLQPASRDLPQTVRRFFEGQGADVLTVDARAR